MVKKRGFLAENDKKLNFLIKIGKKNYFGIINI